MEGLRKLKKQFDENPVPVIAVCAGALMAAARFIDAVGGVRSKNAYARRSKRR